MAFIGCLAFVDRADSKNLLSKITGKGVVQKLSQSASAGILSAMIICSTLSCGKTDNHHEALSYDYGDRIYFERGSDSYSAKIGKSLGDGFYVVSVYNYHYSIDRNNLYDTHMDYHITETTIHESEIGARYVYDQELSGLRVILKGDNPNVVYRHGKIDRTYSNGFAEIVITHETRADGDIVLLVNPFVIFAPRTSSIADGGYIIGDFFNYSAPPRDG